MSASIIKSLTDFELRLTEVPVSLAAAPTTPVTGTFWQATQPVSGTVAATQSGTWDEVGVNDSGNSLTVDAPVGTPAFVRLSDGAAAITTLPVSLATAPTTPVTGTFWQATQPVSIATAPVLVAGSALIGKVGIDQTTPGTTNAVSVQSFKGAANIASSQVTTSTSAATLAIARATRRSILIRNMDAAISVYVGPATVTTGNGMLLKAGESCPFTCVGLIQVIAASGTPVVAIADEYD